MASNFEPIGFSVHSAEDIGGLCERLLPLAETIETASGHYLHWASKSGAQIWIFVDSNGQLVTIAPAFQGRGRVRVGLTQTFPRDSAGAEGGLHGWANPAEKPDAGEYPFVFDSPDFALHGDLRLPQIRSAQISAFAHEIRAFASEFEFAASQAAETEKDPQAMRFGSKTFIPTGLFRAQQTREDPPAFAYFNGHVTAAELRTNELSETQFQWACVETLGGSYDVVAPLALLKGPLKPGQIVSGSFWLCGQVL